MNAPHKLHPEFRAEALRIGGEKVTRERIIEVFNPYSGDLVGTVPKASLDDVRRAFSIAKQYRSTLTRFERANVLDKAAALLRERAAEAAAISSASISYSTS